MALEKLNPFKNKNLPIEEEQFMPESAKLASAVYRKNRAQRRKERRGAPSEFGEALSELASDLDRSMREREIVNRENDYKMVKIAYNGRSYMGEYLRQMRKIPAVLERIYEGDYPQGVIVANHINLRTVEKNNIFGEKINGITLKDIENMPSPLELNDIKKINSVLKLKDEEPRKKFMRDSLTLFPAQIYAHPEDKRAVPQEVQKLHERLTEYFDYYTNLLKNPSLTFEEEMQFVRFVGVNLFLSQALGTVIPGRMGISPSSAAELFRRPFEAVKLFKNFPGTKNSLQGFSVHAKEAFRADVLPEDLHEFVLENNENREEVIYKLKENFPTDKKSVQQIEEYQKSYSLQESLEKYKKRIISDINRSLSHRMEVDIESPVFEKATITSQYKDTMVFIMKLKNSSAYFTLDLGNDGNYYGLPSELKRENPHMMDRILAVILPSVLQAAKEKHPEVEPKELPKPKYKILENNVVEMLPQRKDQDDEEKVSVKKRPAVMTPIAEYLQRKKQEELPEPQEVPERKFFVAHTREEVKEKLGGKKVDENLINKSMEAIRRFEYGYKDGEVIRSHTESGQFRKIRSGDLRILIEHVGEGNFIVRAIDDRERVYPEIEEGRTK